MCLVDGQDGFVRLGCPRGYRLGRPTYARRRSKGVVALGDVNRTIARRPVVFVFVVIIFYLC
jgi:hypothetical protein